MLFSIIIPAYNEELAIGSIIERVLKAKTQFISQTKIDTVEIIVVNDGSKDKTLPIASQYKNIVLISFEKNRGYGAAIKAGFEIAKGEILGFLDADGTCNPLFFVNLIHALDEEQADIAIGSRLGIGSKMPKIRRLGNILYVKIINYLANVKITDCASGMRVLRKKSLSHLYPLPDGLDFTPAMSCKAIMDKKLKIVEIPMDYTEREGRSKLNILKDGIRFSKTIIELVLFYKPLKVLLTVGFFFIFIGLIYSFEPIIYYLIHKSIEESYIYRLISIVVFFIVGTHFITLSIIAERVVSFINNQEDIQDRIHNKTILSFLNHRNALTVGLLIALSGVVLNAKVIYQYVTTQHIYVHWVYPLAGALLVIFGFQLFTFGILQKILSMFKERNLYQNNSTDHFKTSCPSSQNDNP